MPLRIACDLDGTLADLDGALQRAAEQLYGPEVDLRAGSRIATLRSRRAGDEDRDAGHPPDVRKRPVSRQELKNLWEHVCGIDNFWTTLTELEPGSVARLAALAAAGRWELLFLTSRPETCGDMAQMQTQRWLTAHGFNAPSVFVMNGSRGKLADALALDLVIDDRATNVVDVVAHSKARPILVWRDRPVFIPPDAARVADVVSSFGEALDIAERLSAREPRSRGIADRIRRVLRG
jgi:hypothetical protein